MTGDDTLSGTMEQEVSQPDCEHDTSDPRTRIDQYIGNDDDGREIWGRKCLMCGKAVMFKYD